MSAMRPHSKRERRRSSKSGEIFGRAVGGDDDLLVALVQRVEGVEELVLGALLAGEELDVVDEQHVDAAVLVAEAGHLLVAHVGDHLVGELLARDVADGGLRLAALHLVADGVHEVGLAEADAAVEEERVVGLRWALGDRLRGGACELVAGAEDEAVEVVARVELRGGVPVETCLLAVTYGRCGPLSGLARRAGAVRGRGRKAAILARLARDAAARRDRSRE